MSRIPTQKISHACQSSYFTEHEKKRQKKEKKISKKEFLSYQRTRVRRLILMMMTRLLLLAEEALQGVDNRAGLYLRTAENKFKSELSSQSRTS
jgi:hypothetical protein